MSAGIDSVVVVCIDRGRSGGFHGLAINSSTQLLYPVSPSSPKAFISRNGNVFLLGLLASTDSSGALFIKNRKLCYQSSGDWRDALLKEKNERNKNNEKKKTVRLRIRHQ